MSRHPRWNHFRSDGRCEIIGNVLLLRHRHWTVHTLNEHLRVLHLPSWILILIMIVSARIVNFSWLWRVISIDTLIESLIDERLVGIGRGELRQRGNQRWCSVIRVVNTVASILAVVLSRIGRMRVQKCRRCLSSKGLLIGRLRRWQGLRHVIVVDELLLLLARIGVLDLQRRVDVSGVFVDCADAGLFVGLALWLGHDEWMFHVNDALGRVQGWEITGGSFAWRKIIVLLIVCHCCRSPMAIWPITNGEWRVAAVSATRRAVLVEKTPGTVEILKISAWRVLVVALRVKIISVARGCHEGTQIRQIRELPTEFLGIIVVHVIVVVFLENVQAHANCTGCLAPLVTGTEFIRLFRIHHSRLVVPAGALVSVVVGNTRHLLQAIATYRWRKGHCRSGRGGGSNRRVASFRWRIAAVQSLGLGDRRIIITLAHLDNVWQERMSADSLLGHNLEILESVLGGCGLRILTGGPRSIANCHWQRWQLHQTLTLSCWQIWTNQIICKFFYFFIIIFSKRLFK